MIIIFSRGVEFLDATDCLTEVASPTDGEVPITLTVTDENGVPADSTQNVRFTLPGRYIAIML